jgi:multiple sugar transport system substrate-binding protein/raffinose/stachyose/melibiose transport system substrate-binding protein
MKYRTKTGTSAIIGLVAMSSLLTAGCSSAQSGGGDSMTGTIRVLVNITPVLTKSYYQDLMAPYANAHPGVKIQIEAPSGKDVQSTLQQELASGDTPDIVATTLDPVVEPQLTTFPDEAWVNDTPLSDANRIDGKVWQVNTGVQIQSLVFYNKDAFTKAGISDTPKSLDEFTADLKLLKQAGYLPLQTAGEWVTGAQVTMLANPELLKSRGSAWFTDKTDGKVSFAGSPYATYLDAYAGWVKDGLVAHDALGFKYEDSITGFTSGKAATYVMGNWIVPSIDQAKPAFAVGVFPTPTLDGSLSKQMGGGAQPYEILKNSKHQKLDMDLVKWLVTDQGAIAKSLASEGNFRKGVSYDGSALNKSVGAILDAAPGTVPGVSGANIPAGFGDQLDKDVQSLYTGAGAAAVTADLDSWWKSNAK